MSDQRTYTSPKTSGTKIWDEKITITSHTGTDFLNLYNHLSVWYKNGAPISLNPLSQSVNYLGTTIVGRFTW